MLSEPHRGQNLYANPKPDSEVHPLRPLSLQLRSNMIAPVSEARQRARIGSMGRIRALRSVLSLWKYRNAGFSRQQHGLRRCCRLKPAFRRQCQVAPGSMAFPNPHLTRGGFGIGLPPSFLANQNINPKLKLLWTIQIPPLPQSIRRPLPAKTKRSQSSLTSR